MKAVHRKSRTLVVCFKTPQEKQRFIRFAHSCRNTINRVARNLLLSARGKLDRLDTEEEVHFAKWLLTKAKDASTDERRWARSIGSRKSSADE